MNRHGGSGAPGSPLVALGLPRRGLASQHLRIRDASIQASPPEHPHFDLGPPRRIQPAASADLNSSEEHARTMSLTSFDMDHLIIRSKP